MTSVAIIGGGIGGLATANLLAQKGFQVTLYEAHAQLGGRAGRKQQDGFTFDTGPSWYLMPEVFTRYFAHFDIDASSALDIIRLDPAYKVFFDTRPPLTITGDMTRDRAQFEAIEEGSGAALDRYVSRGDAIYRLALDHFLYTDFSQPHKLLRRDILRQTPELVRLLTTPLHRHVTRFVRNLELQQVLEYPMVFLGTSPFNAPAMYSLMSALDFKEGVFYPAKGMYAIVEQLVEIGRSLGVTYVQGQAVRHITHHGKKVTGVTLDDGSTHRHDLIVSNADLHFTETQLLSREVQSYPEQTWHKKEPGISAILMYLGVRDPLPQLQHHNLYFVKEWRKNFEDIYRTRTLPRAASMYVSRTSATDPSTAPEGHENLFVLVPVPSGVELDESALESAAQNYLAQLSKAIGEPELESRIVSRSLFGPNEFRDHFHSWQGSALGPSHTLGQSAFWRTKPRSRKLENLYYVGAGTLPGIGVPMCLISAEIVAGMIEGAA